MTVPIFDFEDAQEEPSVMADENFAIRHAKEYQAYAHLKLSGMLPSIAFRRVFPEYLSTDSFATARIYALESSELFVQYYRQIMLSTPVRELWNEKLAIHRLLTIAQNPFEKGSVHVSAVKELNVLVGITIVDEDGKTRKGGSMADFYRSLAKDEGEAQEPRTLQ